MQPQPRADTIVLGVYRRHYSFSKVAGDRGVGPAITCAADQPWTLFIRFFGDWRGVFSARAATGKAGL